MALGCLSRLFRVDLWVSIMVDFLIPTSFCCKRHAKCIKSQEGRFCFVLGHDIFMDRVSLLCSWALVGRLEYCKMGKAAWVNWATDHWKPLFDYIPTISLLSNGWIVFIFLEEAYCNHILEGIWRIGAGSLVLGCWHSHFDPL